MNEVEPVSDPHHQFRRRQLDFDNRGPSALRSGILRSDCTVMYPESEQVPVADSQEPPALYSPGLSNTVEASSPAPLIFTRQTQASPTGPITAFAYAAPPKHAVNFGRLITVPLHGPPASATQEEKVPVSRPLKEESLVPQPPLSKSSNQRAHGQQAYAQKARKDQIGVHEKRTPIPVPALEPLPPDGHDAIGQDDQREVIHGHISQTRPARYQAPLQQGCQTNDHYPQINHPKPCEDQLSQPDAGLSESYQTGIEPVAQGLDNRQQLDQTKSIKLQPNPSNKNSGNNVRTERTLSTSKERRSKREKTSHGDQDVFHEHFQADGMQQQEGFDLAFKIAAQPAAEPEHLAGDSNISPGHTIRQPPMSQGSPSARLQDGPTVIGTAQRHKNAEGVKMPTRSKKRRSSKSSSGNGKKTRPNHLMNLAAAKAGPSNLSISMSFADDTNGNVPNRDTGANYIQSCDPLPCGPHPVCDPQKDDIAPFNMLHDNVDVSSAMEQDHEPVELPPEMPDSRLNVDDIHEDPTMPTYDRFNINVKSQITGDQMRQQTSTTANIDTGHEAHFEVNLHRQEQVGIIDDNTNPDDHTSMGGERLGAEDDVAALSHAGDVPLQDVAMAGNGTDLTPPATVPEPHPKQCGQKGDQRTPKAHSVNRPKTQTVPRLDESAAERSLHTVSQKQGPAKVQKPRAAAKGLNQTNAPGNTGTPGQQGELGSGQLSYLLQLTIQREAEERQRAHIEAIKLIREGQVKELQRQNQELNNQLCRVHVEKENLSIKLGHADTLQRTNVDKLKKFDKYCKGMENDYGKLLQFKNCLETRYGNLRQEHQGRHQEQKQLENEMYDFLSAFGARLRHSQAVAMEALNNESRLRVAHTALQTTSARTNLALQEAEKAKAVLEKSLKIEMDHNERVNQAFTEQLDDVATRFADLSKRIDLDRKENSTSDQMLKSLNILEELQGRQYANLDDIKGVKETIERARSSICDKVNHPIGFIEGINNRFDSLESLLTEKLKDLEQSTAAKSALEEKLAFQSGQIDILTDKLSQEGSKQRDQLNLLQHELTGCRRQISQLENDLQVRHDQTMSPDPDYDNQIYDLKASCASLRSQMEAKTAELTETHAKLQASLKVEQKLRRDNETFLHRAQEAEIMRAQTVEEKEKLESALAAKIADAQTRLRKDFERTINDKKAEYENAMHHASQKLSKVEEQYNCANEDLAALQAQLSSRKGDLTNELTKIESLEATNSNQATQISELQQAIDRLNETMDAELEPCKQEITTKQSEIDKMKAAERAQASRINKLQQSLDMSKKTERDQSVRIYELEQFLESSKETEGVQTTKLIELELGSDKLKQTIDSQTVMVNGLQQTCDSLKGTEREQAEKITQIQLAFDSAREINRTQEARINELQQALNQSTQTRDTQAFNISELQQIVKDLEATKGMVEDLRDQLRRTTEVVQEKDNELQQLALELNEAETETAGLKGKLKDAEANLKTSQDALQTFQSETTAATTEQEMMYNKEILRLRNEVSHAENERQELATRSLQTVQQAEAALMDEKNHHKERIESLEQQMSVVESQKSDLERKMREQAESTQVIHNALLQEQEKMEANICQMERKVADSEASKSSAERTARDSDEARLTAAGNAEQMRLELEAQIQQLLVDKREAEARALDAEANLPNIQRAVRITTEKGVSQKTVHVPDSQRSGRHTAAIESQDILGKPRSSALTLGTIVEDSQGQCIQESYRMTSVPLQPPAIHTQGTSKKPRRKVDRSAPSSSHAGSQVDYIHSTVSDDSVRAYSRITPTAGKFEASATDFEDGFVADLFDMADTHKPQTPGRGRQGLPRAPTLFSEFHREDEPSSPLSELEPQSTPEMFVRPRAVAQETENEMVSTVNRTLKDLTTHSTAQDANRDWQGKLAANHNDASLPNPFVKERPRSRANTASKLVPMDPRIANRERSKSISASEAQLSGLSDSKRLSERPRHPSISSPDYVYEDTSQKLITYHASSRPGTGGDDAQQPKHRSTSIKIGNKQRGSVTRPTGLVDAPKKPRVSKGHDASIPADESQSQYFPAQSQQASQTKSKSQSIPHTRFRSSTNSGNKNTPRGSGKKDSQKQDRYSLRFGQELE